MKWARQEASDCVAMARRLPKPGVQRPQSSSQPRLKVAYWHSSPPVPVQRQQHANSPVFKRNPLVSKKLLSGGCSFPASQQQPCNGGMTAKSKGSINETNYAEIFAMKSPKTNNAHTETVHTRLESIVISIAKAAKVCNAHKWFAAHSFTCRQSHLLYER